MPLRVRRATLLAFCLHGVLILTAQYRLSYDAYNHMFFADHYLKDWWLLWESRWYTGFLIISYPPLTHQLIGLLGHLIGVDAAFALILWVTLSAYPSAVYVFGRIFTGWVPASYAAIGAALLPSLFLTAHTFGQLPTLVGTLFALFGAAVLKEFLCNGKPLTGLLAVFLFTTMMAAHHAVLLFVPFLVGAVLLRLILQQRQRKGSLGIGGEVSRFWGVNGVYTPFTPQNLETSPPIPKEPPGENTGVFLYGAGGSRTHTSSHSTDFKSAASAIPPLPHAGAILHENWVLGHEFAKLQDTDRQENQDFSFHMAIRSFFTRTAYLEPNRTQAGERRICWRAWRKPWRKLSAS